MFRKLSFIISILLALALVRGASAVTWTNADPNDDLWSTPGNWDGGVPTGPDDGDTAQLDNPDVNGPLIRDGIDAVCVRMKGPGYSIPPGSDITITGGTLTFGRYWRVGFGPGAGIVNMSGGIVTNECNYEIYMNAASVFDLSDGLVNSGFYLPSSLSLGYPQHESQYADRRGGRGTGSVKPARGHYYHRNSRHGRKGPDGYH
ncbi:MAG: hypothetical protein ACYTBJ_23420 [Planctomycetota bacterium]|jgi:hypothetical protein